ncbi:hypothetical protein Bca4012_010778 [Brassica carinata]|uniref:Uncharacterized protein n=1 Tax=Brassica carinata TaxID=52824 RepID=A0A8X7S3M6_BRACI|nr:hypothetical protein Bca52824_035684 [Brassica carinata]
MRLVCIEMEDKDIVISPCTEGAPTMVETRVLVEVECIDEDSLVMTREEELEVTNPRPGACNAMSNLSFLFDLT